MKSKIFLLTSSIFSMNLLVGQPQSHCTEMDTIAVFNDTVLVQFKRYVDDKVTAEGHAILYPDSLEVKVSKGWFKSELVFKHVTQMAYHGQVKANWTYGKYRVGNYQFGVVAEMRYYDSFGSEISKNDFYANYRSQFDPEKGLYILITGVKKKKWWKFK